MSGGDNELRLKANDDAEVISYLDDLALAASAGNSAALDQLLFEIDARRLAEPAIRRVLISADDVDDVVQDVLLSVAQSIGQFEGRSRFTTWLHTIARNKAVALLRRKKGGTEEFDETMPNEAMPSDVARLSSIVATHETIHAVLAGLPAHYREAVRLRDLEGMSYSECAEALDLNLNTVRSHIARGRALLCEALAV